MPKKWPAFQQGQRNLALEPVISLSLPDKIPKGVHTLFIGVNPGIRSAKIGHYYAGHSNFFWKLLHESGIWPVPITTQEDDSITQEGFGLTDTCKRPTPGTGALKRVDFAETQNHIHKVVKRYKPALVVFVSKTAVRAYLAKPTAPVTYGMQAWKVDGSAVYVLPSTSGASQADTNYPAKLRWFRELRKRLPPREQRP